ncbi:CAP domain-containing protein [Planosporangium sp. 12N6]|uniref:CAP domain-containing protein n=1 Tax=Planosporangium spinosum TaxID=3402278 RepID=UPI003CE74454
MSKLSGRTPDDRTDPHPSDPWAHTAPLPAAHPGPARRGPYDDRTQAYDDDPTERYYDTDPYYGGRPYAGPPPGPWAYEETYDDEPAPAPGARRRMGPLAITGMVCAIVISIGLVTVLLGPVFAGRSDDNAKPNLPGLLDQPPAATLAPQATPEIPVPTESPDATPTPTPSPTPSATGGRVAVGNTAVEDAAVALVNGLRRRTKCDPVRTDPRLRTSAREHSADMAANGFLGQTGSDRSSAADRMRAAGYHDPLSENVARGAGSARDVVQAWLDNKQSRQRMLDCDARAIGVGVAVSADGTPYWTQDLGK